MKNGKPSTTSSQRVSLLSGDQKRYGCSRRIYEADIETLERDIGVVAQMTALHGHNFIHSLFGDGRASFLFQRLAIYNNRKRRKLEVAPCRSYAVSLE